MSTPAGAAASLGKVKLLAGAEPAVLDQFAARVRWVNAAPGQTVVGFEDRTTDVYLILQGAVRVAMRTADGERTEILGDFTAGDIVGEMSAIDDAPRSAQVEALVATRLCVAPARALLDLAFGSPQVGLRLMRLLTARVRLLNLQRLERTALPAQLRLATELLRLARPRADGSGIVSPPPTQEELASRIGTRRETVSRELAGLRRAGLLQRTQGAYVLPDPAALRCYLAGGGRA